MGAARCAQRSLGDWAHFVAYAGRINPELPPSLVPAVGAIATAVEVTIAVALIIGFETRRAALAGGVLLSLFALGMTFGTGVKTALDASVFAASAGAFLLSRAATFPLSVDERRRRGTMT